MSEEETKIPEELSVEEFLALSEVAPAKEKVADKDLMEFLQTARRTNVIAAHFKVSYSAMLARLKRLAADNKVVKRYKEKAAFWIAKAALP
jgi:hypothetical protein